MKPDKPDDSAKPKLAITNKYLTRLILCFIIYYRYSYSIHIQNIFEV